MRSERTPRGLSVLRSSMLRRMDRSRVEIPFQRDCRDLQFSIVLVEKVTELIYLAIDLYGPSRP